MSGQQQQPPQLQLQYNQQQQQIMAMSNPMMNPMMPATAFYLPPSDNVNLQGNAVAPPMGYVTTVPNNRDPTTAETYSSGQSIGLGITLIIIGVLAFIFNGVGFAVNDYFAFIGHGFWCGALVIHSKTVIIQYTRAWQHGRDL
jgi:hypothetical protein